MSRQLLAEQKPDSDDRSKIMDAVMPESAMGIGAIPGPPSPLNQRRSVQIEVGSAEQTFENCASANHLALWIHWYLLKNT